MRIDTFTTEPIVTLLRNQTVASLPEIMQALGTPSHRTTFRKIALAGCRSSYSHSGQYYTLDELASYDDNGLWSHQQVRFSRAGSLLATLEALIAGAPAGHFASELTKLVGVDTYNALRKLIVANRLSRHPFDGRYLYCSATRAQQRIQLSARESWRTGVPIEYAEHLPAALNDVPVSVASATLLSVLDERQRRLFAGLESLRYGYGGDRRVAAILGMSPTTVATGRKQLLAGDLDPERVRKSGGGRKLVEKKRRTQRSDCRVSDFLTSKD